MKRYFCSEMAGDSKQDVHLLSSVALTHYLQGSVHSGPNSMLVNSEALKSVMEKLEKVMGRKLADGRM